MNIVAKIACRTIGVAGMGLACYDAAKISRQFSQIGSDHAQERYLENVYYSSRTLDDVSYTTNAMREKAFNLRSRSPIPGTVGKIKGGFQGLMYGLANNLPIIACSALAILSKNFFAKAGAIGIGALTLFKFLREGFGLGKNNPMR